jgi:hypothetical protein
MEVGRGIDGRVSQAGLRMGLVLVNGKMEIFGGSANLGKTWECSTHGRNELNNQM